MATNASKMTDFWLIIHGGLIKSGHCICIQKSSEFMKNEQLVLKQATLFFNEYKAIYGKDIQGEFVTGKSSSKSKYELNKDFFEKIKSFQYYDSETLYKVSISKIQEQMREVFESSCRRIKQDKEEEENKEEEDEEEEKEEEETKKTKNIKETKETKETKKTKNIQEEPKSDKKSEVKESKSDKKSEVKEVKESKSDKKSEVKEVKESKSDKKSEKKPEVKESKSDKKKNDEKVTVMKSKKIDISSDSEYNSEEEEN